ncbi:leucine-rich repeat domain-containing protein, partial [Mucilaginibacter sp.]|uniref:leucine-rich repeat domain-containing protein n=1 Tax=Mucilaginibacter sp. TaxID=1882438 RepID=UPI00374CEF86
MKKNLALCLLLSFLCIKKNYAQFVALQDSLALVDLYDSTDGPNWFFKDHWKTTDPVSMWTGVSVYNNRVTGISFVGNRMKGKIPASFKNLTKLERLHLLDNGLKANMSEFVDSLTSLVYFNVGELEFTNEIPESVSKLVNLQQFTLYGCFGLEHIPSSFKTMNKLTEMDIQNNGITGDISNSIPPNVAALNVSLNKLNFDPIEKLAKRFKNNLNFYYLEQAKILTQTDADKVWVSAGGTVSNNTYKWYKVGSGVIDSTKGDSVYYPSSPGSYYAEVSNSIATGLILTSNALKAQGIRASICSG